MQACRLTWQFDYYSNMLQNILQKQKALLVNMAGRFEYCRFQHLLGATTGKMVSASGLLAQCATFHCLFIKFVLYFRLRTAFAVNILFHIRCIFTPFQSSAGIVLLSHSMHHFLPFLYWIKKGDKQNGNVACDSEATKQQEQQNNKATK